MNDKLKQYRTGIETELTAVAVELGKLREDKAALAAKIRDKVAEQAELRSALSRLTPKTRKPKDAVETAEAPAA